MNTNQQNENTSNEQPVQRLGDGENTKASSPRILSNSLQYDPILLEKRQALLDSGKYKGNTRELTNYKKDLPLKFEQFAFCWCVGLLLSDASLQANNNCTSFRLKMQQSENNKSLLYESMEVLKPWTMEGVSDIGTRKIGTFYREAQTISHEAFSVFANLFQNPNISLKKGACINKVIQPNINEYLTPLAVAIWFAGDGGRQDYSENSGKAIQFHAQGFDKDSLDNLAKALCENFGWDVTVKKDYMNTKSEQFYLIHVSPADFESFVDTIGPSIPVHFQAKLPAPRSLKSRHRKSKEK